MGWGFWFVKGGLGMRVGLIIIGETGLALILSKKLGGTRGFLRMT